MLEQELQSTLASYHGMPPVREWLMQRYCRLFLMGPIQFGGYIYIYMYYGTANKLSINEPYLQPGASGAIDSNCAWPLLKAQDNQVCR